MFYSGIADEGAEDLAGQIRAHQELGWKHVEIRNLSGTNLTDITDEEFEQAAAALGEGGGRSLTRGDTRPSTRPSLAAPVLKGVGLGDPHR